MARGHSTGVSPAGPEVRRARPIARVAAGVAIAGCAGLAAWQGTLGRQSSAAHWSVAMLIALGGATAWIAGARRQRLRSRAWAGSAWRAVGEWRRRPPVAVAGVAGWVVLAAAAIGWDLNSFIHQSHDLPTLSHFIGFVTGVPAGRGLLFAAWLALGGYLALGWRRPR